MVTYESVVKLFTALLTPMLAVTTGYIAVQQYRLSKKQLTANADQFRLSYQLSQNQFRLALLERRYKVYEATTKLLGKAIQRARVSDEDLQTFLWETRETEFLFGSELKAYLDEVYKNAADLLVFDDEVNPENSESRRRAMLWFAGQLDNKSYQAPFLKYMAFKD